ncbi:MAG: glycosyltransferase family 39 protein, partial [Bacteroidota bacterium]
VSGTHVPSTKSPNHQITKLYEVRRFSKTQILTAAAILLLFPALLTHLGLIAFYDDEGIRSLVALEMKISGNYLTPTLFGEFYYNKPPLYNWILLLFFELTGRADEFSARLPTVIFLLAYAGSVYFFFNRLIHPNSPGDLKSPGEFSPPGSEGIFREKKFSIFSLFPVLAAFSLVTCGRILFWDSMLALIDTCFSWVMFCLFMLIYREGERERFGRLFVLAYLLAAIGFLLKGLPALVFLGIALLTYFIWQKKWRRLFSWAHLGGMAVFLALVGGYYFLYAQKNGLEEVFKTLFSESAKRTFVEHGFGQTALHLLTFPFEMWYHFLPWTLLTVYFFRKNAWRLVRENKFITWNLLVFFTTILPYWTSVEVYPRYLLMHVPLVFSAFFYLHFKNKEAGSKLTKAVEMTFFVLCLVATAASLLPPFWEAVQDVPFLKLKSAALAVSLAFLSWLYWRWQAHRFLIFVLVLLVARLGFDWFILPSRLKIECSTRVRETVLAAAEKLDGQPVHILENSLGLQPATGFYFTRETGQLVRSKFNDFDTVGWYIIHPGTYHPYFYERSATFVTKYRCQEMALGKLTDWFIQHRPKTNHQE